MKRVGWILWTTGMIGVILVALQVLPQMVRGQELPLPLWAITLVSILQSAALLALMVFAGVKLAPKCGLGAPILGNLNEQSFATLAHRLFPALVWGIAAGALLVLAAQFAPDEVSALEGKISLPLASRLLYGGITEELLVRWGLMTFLFWAFLRLSKIRDTTSLACLIPAIVISAFIFALGHLPAARNFIGFLNADIVFYIIIMNTGLGCLYGWLFYRRGIEAAILAHAMTHLTAFLALIVLS